MPSYPYLCECGIQTDKAFPFGKKPNEIVCECGGRARRLICFPAVRFIGDGFANSTDWNKDTPIFHDPVEQMEYDEAQQKEFDSKKQRLARETEAVVTSHYAEHSDSQETGGQQEKKASATSSKKETCQA